VGSCPWVLHVSINCVSDFSLLLHASDKMEDLRGKAGSACEEFEDNEDGILG